MSFRSYVKVARPAEHNSTFTKQRNVTGVEGGGGPGVPGPEGPQGPEGPPGKDGEDGKDGVVDPSKLNMEFNVDQIELKDADGNFCGLHVKGINGITVTEDETYGNQTMVIGLPEGFGGGPSLDTLPWISMKRFKCEIFGMNNDVPDFTTTYDVNPLVNYFWRWDMDLYNNGNWKDVDDFDSSELASCPISIQMEGYLRLGNVTNERYPNAKIRYVVWVEDFDGKSSELSSSEEPAFGHTGWNVPYDPPLFTDGGGGSTVDYASREYVDEQVASIPPIPPVDHLVSKNGESTVGSDFRLKQDKKDGSGKNNYLAIHDDYMYLYHVAAPSASHHGVNKKYVDDAIAALRAELNP